MTWIKSGTPVGIGSVPYEKAEEALKLIKDCTPDWPHWPQLPASSPEEGFVLQYVQPLIRLGLIEVKQGKDPVFTRNIEGWDEKVVKFYELYLAFMSGDKEAEEFFALKGQSFAGLDSFIKNFSTVFPEASGVKGQLSGPLTVGLEIKDEVGRTCFYDDNLKDLLVKCLQTQGIMQVRSLQSLGKKVLLFIDDPAVFLLGSASYITLTKENISAALLEIMQPLVEMGVKLGVHVCAQTDWSMLFDLPLDVVSFDAYSYFPSMIAQAEPLQAFLQRGGRMAWGLIPTSEAAWQVSIESLQEMFSDQCRELAKVGVDIELLQQNILWTPSCGTGTLSRELAQHIYGLLKRWAEQGK